MDEDAARGRVEARLEAGENVEAPDLEGHIVRVKRREADFVLFWGDEPGYKGDATTIARMFVQATLY